MGPWGEIFTPLTLQESYSIQDHLLHMDSIWIQSQLHAKQALDISEDSPSDPNKKAYPLGTHPFDLKVSNLWKNKKKQLKKTHVIQRNGLSTSHTQEFNHLHTNIHFYTLHFIHDIHISTRICHIQNKRGVTEVCRFGHFWLSYGRCATSGSTM